MITSWGKSEAGKAWSVYIDPNGILSVSVYGGNFKGSTTINDGNWHHIVAVIDDRDRELQINDIRIYIDGVEEEITRTYGTDPGPQIDTRSSTPVTIGVRNYDGYPNGWTYKYYFNGLMDDFRIYSRALDDDEIQELALSPVPTVYLPFDNDANDFSGNEYHGTEYGDPNCFDSAINLDGVDDYVELSGEVINPGTDSFSAVAWIYLDSKLGLSSQIILQQNDEEGDLGRAWLYRDASDDTLRSSIGNGSTVGNAVFSNTDQWHHIGVTYDGQTVRLYADGQECGSSVRTAESCNGNLLIGRHKSNDPNYAYWDGLIDELQIYKRVLSKDEIAELAGQAFYLESHWGFDGDPNDSSGNGFDGTVYGDPNWIDGYIDGGFHVTATETYDGDCLEVEDFSDQLMGKNYTVSWWTKPDSLGTREIILLGVDYDAHDFEFYQNDDSLIIRADYGSSSDINVSGVFAVNQWAHICVIGTDDGTSVYIDGDRERRPYEGDAYINQLSHYAVDAEYGICRKTADHLFEFPTWPTEWEFHMHLILWEDYMYSGNKAYLEKYYSNLKGIIEKEDYDENGFIKNTKKEDIIDWPREERDGYELKDVNNVPNAFLCKSLELMSKIAGALDNEKDSIDYAEKYTQYKENFNKIFWNKEKGIYIDAIGSDHSSLHANIFPIAFGLSSEEQNEKIIPFIKSKGMTVSVYGAQYLLDALYLVGEDDYAMQLITNDSERGWLKMIERGATITWEAWNEKVKGNLDWNHAWGAAPGNIIARRIFGIQPLEPGFKKALIQPQFSGLSKGEIKHPTISGPIEMEFEMRESGIFLKIKTEMPARLVLPVHGKVFSVTLNRKQIETKIEGEELILEIMGGENEVEVFL